MRQMNRFNYQIIEYVKLKISSHYLSFQYRFTIHYFIRYTRHALAKKTSIS